MTARRIASVVIIICGLATAAEAAILFSGERKLNNLVSELLEASLISKPGEFFTFRYPFASPITGKVFRAKDTTAKLTVSDWQSEKEPGVPIGQEQTFNFLEIQPYWE